VKKHSAAVALGLMLAFTAPTQAVAAGALESDDGGLHVRVLPTMAGALIGGAATIIIAPMIFPGLAAAAGSSAFVQPLAVGRALVGFGLGGWLGDRILP